MLFATRNLNPMPAKNEQLFAGGDNAQIRHDLRGDVEKAGEERYNIDYDQTFFHEDIQPGIYMS